jgi:hypothetical protein
MRAATQGRKRHKLLCIKDSPRPWQIVPGDEQIDVAVGACRLIFTAQEAPPNTLLVEDLKDSLQHQMRRMSVQHNQSPPGLPSIATETRWSVSCIWAATA